MTDAGSGRFVPICSIGASAGGVEALRGLFSKLPADLGLAYVVIVHLSPDHPSALSEILGGSTAMPVLQVEDGPKLQPNCVYVIPPDRALAIEGDRITTRPFTEPRGRRAPIDMFFRSVAASHGDGVAVVLSGAGADGALGIKAIHEGGGMVFVQDPREAKFPSMPQNAIATGLADFVGPVERLAERLVELARNKDAVRLVETDSAASDVNRIIAFLKARTGHDFSSYKPATVNRRIARRMQALRMTDLTQYGNCVRDTPEEAQELFGDLLISVTMFFRDDSAFTALKDKGFAELFDNLADEGLRIWVVGCATGEEAYSVAILVLEEAERRQVSTPIQIFASDLDEGALATAREARYPRAIEADVSEARLKRFFVDEGTHYRVRKEVRETVLFATHSVLKDPPFLRLDLISCRNLMIYLERPQQNQLITMFHYALRPRGLLFVGSAETADSTPQLFSVLDREARLYRSRPQAARTLPRLPPVRSDLELPAVPSKRPMPRDRPSLVPQELHLAALEQFAPPSILIDEDHQILHMSSGAGRFIRPPGGTFTGKLPPIVLTELRLNLQIALDTAMRQGLATLSPPLGVELDGFRHLVSLYVRPITGEPGAGTRFLILFIDSGTVSDEGEDPPSTEAHPDAMRRLYSELRLAQDAALSSRAEQETSVQELQAANEELQSVNEEYRSTSEELETSKEELQSMNEELQTVNAELKAKLESISGAHSDLQNLTAATEIGTLFLDTDLRIRMFTAPVAELFNITDGDFGRAITDFTHRLAYDKVEGDARDVLRHLTPLEREIATRDDRWFMMRLRPYRTVDNRISGIVLTFVEATSRILAERELLASERRYRTLFDSIDEGFCVAEVKFDENDLPVDFRFEEVNAAFGRQTNLQQAEGKWVSSLVPGLERHWFEHYGRVARSRQAERFEAPAQPLGRFYEVFAFPFGKVAGNQIGILFNDISMRKGAERQREMLTHELSHRVKNTLAVVQALVNLPVGPAATIQSYRSTLLGRLQALGRAHSQLLANNWQRVDLGDLVRETMSPYRDATSDRITLSGDKIELSPRQGISMALILHELATNAAKYGALSKSDGRLALSWQTADGVLKFRWQESDGPAVELPAETGFGSKLIREAIAYELAGEAKLDFAEDGLICD
ncbi:MAG: chemotaxis protein CheB, partial [bacterium]